MGRIVPMFDGIVCGIPLVAPHIGTVADQVVRVGDSPLHTVFDYHALVDLEK